jgi:hypothetical protein
MQKNSKRRVALGNFIMTNGLHAKIGLPLNVSSLVFFFYGKGKNVITF